jgi:hypothetical protein
LLAKLADNTADKFIAHEVSIEAVKAAYSASYANVFNDPKQTGEVKVLDDDGKEIFANVRFKDLSAPIYYDPD